MCCIIFSFLNTKLSVQLDFQCRVQQFVYSGLGGFAKPGWAVRRAELSAASSGSLRTYASPPPTQGRVWHLLHVYVSRGSAASTGKLLGDCC